MNVRALRLLIRTVKENSRRTEIIAERLGISFEEEEEPIKTPLPPVPPAEKPKKPAKKKTQKKSEKARTPKKKKSSAKKSEK